MSQLAQLTIVGPVKLVTTLVPWKLLHTAKDT